MIPKKQILTVISFMFFSLTSFNQPISKQSAVSMVKNQILGSDTLTCNIYMYPSIYMSDFCVTRKGDSIHNPYTYSRMFFIDEMPEYNWGHDCQYIFIDTISGNYSLINHHFFTSGYKVYWDTISIVYHEIENLPIVPPESPTVYTNPFDPNKYALIFSGDETDLRWNDLSHMYSALKLNGFTDEHIYVFIPDEANNWSEDLDKDLINDVDGLCTHDNIQNTLDDLEEILTENDIFFFYCSTHGETTDHLGNSSLVLQDKSEELTDDELAIMVEGFKCSEMIFLIDACYSGGFKLDLEGDHRTVQTCTDEVNVIWIQKELGYNFLTYAYATALKGCHPICIPYKQPWTINCFGGSIGEQDLGEVWSEWDAIEDINPDELEFNGNGDGFYQTGEAFRYAEYFSWQISTRGENYQNHGFLEDVLSVNGIVGNITTSQTVEGNFLVGGPLSIEPDVDLTLYDNSSFYLHDAELSIAADASLTLGENTLITGDPSGVVDVDGALITDYHNDFSAAENGTLDIQLGSEPFEIADGTFTNCQMESHADSLKMIDCFLNHSLIEHYFHDLIISGSSFTNSSISAVHFSLSNPPLEKIFKVIGCNFHTAHEESNAAIELYGYRNFTISGNSIDNEDNPEDVDNGISINYSGGLAEDNTHTVIDNEIFCSSASCDNDLAGITVYSGVAEINGNNIHDNQIGIQSLNFSNLQVIGNKNASFEYETQRIKNNKYCQIFASANAFPVLTSWNAIYSTETNDCFIVHDVDMQNLPPDVDVSYNYWGSGFEPDRNLCPPGHYVYRPEWVLQEEEDNLLSNAQQLYESAMIQIEESNFTEAKSTLQEVINLYPGEEPAIHSLKDIFVLEPFADNDFSALKSWYLTDSVIVNQDNLFQLADNLANKCDENLGNFSAAIEWYESKIDNPETLEDSVFAIIDLEHLYLQISNDTTQRSFTYTGKYSQYKPASFKAYKDHRDLLIELLHSWDNEQANDDNPLIKNDINDNGYFVIAPNPFTNKTKINYHLDNESTVQINIFNNLGQLVETVTEIGKSKGNCSYEFDASELNTGIYFCTLIVNGKATASMKMMVL